jgi:parallel beta-helix repeat protein
MKESWESKLLTITVILLFIELVVVPDINANMTMAHDLSRGIRVSNFAQDLGTLSGHVTDALMHPIEGAVVRVFFHNTSREDYSDAMGYYHVTDIRICNCTKNATCSKVGYNTAWVYLSIEQNTTHDFVLTRKDHWLYVGGSGPGNYTKIQDAINAASPGDAVFVYSGTYYEHLIISKAIDLLGEDKNTTIIDGGNSGTVVHIKRNNVKIAGFLIQNNAPITPSTSGINIHSGFNTIIGNNIYCNEVGIYLDNTSPNFIVGNTLSGNLIAIMVYRSSHVIISDNVIVSNKNYGISFPDMASNCSITGNMISNNGYGIYLYQSSTNNLIERNTLLNNKECGLEIALFSDNNRIQENNFINNRMKNAADVWNRGNVWDANYWDPWIGLNLHGPLINKIPKIIGLGGFFRSFGWAPFLVVDWHPAQEPYDIEG